MHATLAVAIRMLLKKRMGIHKKRDPHSAFSSNESCESSNMKLLAVVALSENETNFRGTDCSLCRQLSLSSHGALRWKYKPGAQAWRAYICGVLDVAAKDRSKPHVS